MSKECNENSSQWIDRRINTPLNACSLEVFQQGLSSTSICNNQGLPVHFHPLVIGCYELCDSACSKNNDEEEGNDSKGEHTAEELEEQETATSTKSRNGALLLHMIPSSSSLDKSFNAGKQLQFGNCNHELHTDSGILDGKWFQRSTIFMTDSIQKETCLYATACASGAIELYNLCLKCDDNRKTEIEGDKSTDWKLELISSSKDSCRDSDIDDGIDQGLALSLAFDESMDLKSTSTTRIVSSYSKGSLAIHNVDISICDDHQARISRTHCWNAHTLFGCPAEVWTTCFASNQHYTTHSDIVISGGDDCKMKFWDLRIISNESKNRPIHCIGEEEFGAGVTAVSYHPVMEHLFCSGSYDESIRLWDMRKMKSKEPLCNMHVGGGVWRVKWHPNELGKILVGAMHGGCRVVNVPVLSNQSCPFDDNASDLQYDINIEKEFLEHKSMAYGADWIHLEGSYEAAASCSFYDRQAFIWPTR